MQVNAQAHHDVLQTAREYGAALGEHIIAMFGEQIPNEKVDEAVALVTTRFSGASKRYRARRFQRPWLSTGAMNA